MTNFADCGSMLEAMRNIRPLVQCITNDVAMNIAANVLLAAGASPAMVSAEEEAAEFARIASAVTVNIGTLWAGAISGMKSAAIAARQDGKPWVLDPVAHYATQFRRQTIAELLELKPTIVRGNASEIMALAGLSSMGRGVDSGDSSDAAESAALTLATKHDFIVAVTGETDFVTDGIRSVRIAGGSSMMPSVTALGCALTGLIGAFSGAIPDRPFDATVAALSMFAVCGSDAARDAKGPGSFQVLFLDALTAIDAHHLNLQARITLL